jgi:DnaK suppressor protein
MKVKKIFITKVIDALEEEKATILAKQAQPIDIDISGDEVDEIQGKILANIQAQFSVRDKLKLKSIDIALEKINEGTFGFCEECGEKIAEKRLTINPMFINCINCAETLEAEEKRHRRI